MIIDLNLRAMMHLTHAFMPHLVKNGGHVVNIGSLASRSAAPFQAAYNATKFGMVGFSRCLASPPILHPSAASAREWPDAHHAPSPPPLPLRQIRADGVPRLASVRVAIYPGTVVGDEGLGEEVRKLTSKEDWDYIIKTFGSTTLVAQAEAVIRAVNYDEPELFSVEGGRHGRHLPSDGRLPGQEQELHGACVEVAQPPCRRARRLRQVRGCAGHAGLRCAGGSARSNIQP